MARDFTTFDAYLDASSLSDVTYPDGIPLMYYESGEARATTNSLALRPVRQDTGQNPNQLRPESGDYFGQNEFHNGSGQLFAHPDGDPSAFFASEGLDFSEGKVRHLWRTQPMSLVGTGGFSAAGGGRFAQAGGALFTTASSSTIRRTTDFFSTTDENPHGAEAATNVYDITSRGDEVFAALGANGVHRRPSAGPPWAHWQPATGTNLTFGGGTNDDVRLVRFVRDRMIVVANAGRSIFEVVATSTLTLANAMVTLPEGWTFTDIAENGPYIYASAVNVAAGLSRIHIFGLNSAGSAMEHKGSTSFPTNQLVYSIKGYLATMLIGVGRRNRYGGYDPILYKATPNDGGFLAYSKVAESLSTGTHDLAIRAIEPDGERVYVGWSLNAGNPLGARQGIAVYDLARDAFFHHQYDQVGDPAGIYYPRPIQGITIFKGILAWCGELVTREDANQGPRLGSAGEPVRVISSMADFGNVGLKYWDVFEIRHKPLTAQASVDVYYSTKHPEENVWTLAGTSDVDGSEGATFRVSGVSARALAVKIESRQPNTLGVGPEIIGFSVRSHPTVETGEWTLSRYIRLLDADRRSTKGQRKFQNPRTVRRLIQDLLYDPVTLYEEDGTWTCRLEQIADFEPAQPHYDATGGNAHKDAYVMQLRLQGTRDA